MSPGKEIPYLNAINAGLSQAVPAIGLIFGAVNLVREMFRRRSAGEPELTVAEQAQYMVDGGKRVASTSLDWLAANGYDAKGNKVVS